MPTVPLPSALRRLLPALLAGAALLPGAPPARADGCDDCRAPTLADLEAAPGFRVELRLLDGWPHLVLPDEVAVNGDECSYVARSAPALTTGPTWSVLRAAGEVLNCPWARTSDSVSFEVAEGDTTEWKVQGEVGATASLAAVQLAAKVGGGYGRGTSVTEVRTHTTTIEAQPGHRVPWEGYFEVAPLTLSIEFAVTRRWSWWTKHPNFGDTVLASGSVWIDCGTERVTLTRRAALRGWVKTGDRPCGEPDLGAVTPPAPPPPASEPTPALTPASGPAPVAPPRPGQEPSGEPGQAPGPAPLPVPDTTPPTGPVAPPAGSPVPAPTPSTTDPDGSGDLGDAPTGPFLRDDASTCPFRYARAPRCAAPERARCA